MLTSNYFRGELILKPFTDAQGRRVYELGAPLYFHSGTASVEVPKGFITDLTSSPRVLWGLFPPDGRYTKAAIVHDFLYYTQCPKDIADLTFYDGMICLGVPKWKAKIFYHAVKWFGASAYASHKIN